VTIGQTPMMAKWKEKFLFNFIQDPPPNFEKEHCYLKIYLMQNRLLFEGTEALSKGNWQKAKIILAKALEERNHQSV
jgi:hypothetical protein